MNTIPEKFNKNGWVYVLAYRCTSVAVYEQRDPETGITKYYEVHHIRHAKERSIDGRKLPAAELLAATQLWGKFGWTFRTKPEARIKYLQLWNSLEKPYGGPEQA